MNNNQTKGIIMVKNKEIILSAKCINEQYAPDNIRFDKKVQEHFNNGTRVAWHDSTKTFRLIDKDGKAVKEYRIAIDLRRKEPYMLMHNHA